MPSPIDVRSALHAPGRPQALRVFMLFALTLLLQIPILFMWVLVNERRGRQVSATREIASKWGEQQVLTGPALVVPWAEQVVSTDGKGQRRETLYERRLVLLPDSLHVSARLGMQERSRGIYHVPVYRLDALVHGRFARPDFGKLGIDSTRIDWRRAALSIGISDARAIQQQSVLAWGDRRIDLEPGNAGVDELGSGIHADLGLAAAPWGRTFSLPLSLNGSGGAFFTPFGRQTVVEISGDWPSPSFQGAWLPTSRAVTDSGFRAEWDIPALGRSFPQTWGGSKSAAAEDVRRSNFGLEFQSSIDAYRMCERTLKYAALFLILTFTAFWLLEVLGGRSLHPIQYALIGAALCLFMMLELAMSEHVGFGPAYAIASAAVVGLIVHYAAGVLGSVMRALGVGAGLGVLYAFHYVVLRNEDYALLLGSLLLFVALAAVMTVTRRISWYGNGTPEGPAKP